METSNEETISTIRNYVLNEFLPDEEPGSLTEEVRLVSEGIIDSMGSLRLVAFLEEKFGIQVPAHFIDAEHLDTVDSIGAFVSELRKQGAQSN